MRRLVAGALATATVSVGLVALTLDDSDHRPGRAGLSARSSCADGLVVAVPGAGEGSSAGAAAGRTGDTLGPLVDSTVAGASQDRRTVETRVVWAETLGPKALAGRGTATTPADRAVTRKAWKAWRAPSRQLAELVRAEISSAVEACPDQLVHLVGYAQGAEAVHRVLARASDDLRSRTAGVVLVADPSRVSGSRGQRIGDPAAPRRASGVSVRFDRTPLPALPASDWHGPVVSVCTATDVACDLGPSRFRHAQRVHRRYDAAPLTTRLADTGATLGHRLALWPKPRAGETVTGVRGLLVSKALHVDVAPEARDAVRWAAVSDLPPGLRLTKRGRVTGTPQQAGTFVVDFTVRNTTSAAVSRPVPGQVTVTVKPGAQAQVSTGGRHTCSVHADGTLWCWGANFYGQVGDGTTASTGTPVQVGKREDWRSVSAGGMHTCGVRDNGTLWCWGLNYRGQLGMGDRTDRKVPRQVGSAKDWASVSAGWVHTCAVRTDQSTWCWGDNDYGQLGDGSRKDRHRPVAVAKGTRWQQVSAGGWHSCGVRADGAALCWGRNLSGQVGDGTLLGRLVPTRVGDAADWVSVDPGWTSTCGLHADGTAACWGGDEAGQLGNGGKGATRAPQPVGGSHLFASLAVGTSSACGLDVGQAVWCWGTGRYGQSGSDTSREDVPVQAFGDGAWTQLDLGWLHACGLQSTDAPLCWGNNETGQLGNGKVGASQTGPTAVVAARPFSADVSRLIEQDGSHAVPATRVQPPVSARRSTSSLDFNLVSFNVLGSNHTSPRRDAGEFSPARVRMEWLVDYLGRINGSIVGFQEIQRDQLAWFDSAAGDDYAVWPGTSQGSEGIQTTIAWRRSAWRLIDSDTVRIPFITMHRRMPLVQLENKETGKRVWVMNVHNAPRDYQAQRVTAVKKEIRRLKKVVGKGDTVLVTGDFNERQRAFCQMTGKLPMVAPRGGSYTDGTCYPPKGFVRIDWIFGSKNASYSDYTEDKSPLVRMITDHSVLRTHVSVP